MEAKPSKLQTKLLDDNAIRKLDSMMINILLDDDEKGDTAAH